MAKSKEQQAIDTNAARRKSFEQDKKAADIAAKAKNSGNINQNVQNINYTLFASGLNYGGRNTELDNKNYKDNIAILFDVVTDHSLELTSQKTSYPIDSKSTRSDHIVNEDGKFTFTAYVNSSPMYIIERNYIDQDTDKENTVESQRPKKAYEALVKIRQEKKPVTLVTEDFILTDYAITSISVQRQASEGSALVFDITLEEYRVVTVGKVKVKVNNRVKSLQKNKNTGSKNSGDKDLEFSEMKSPIKTGVGRAVEEQLQKVGITVPKIDSPAGVVKPDGSIVRY